MELLRQMFRAFAAAAGLVQIREAQSGRHRLHPGEVAPVGKKEEQSGEKGGNRKRSLLV